MRQVFGQRQRSAAADVAVREVEAESSELRRQALRYCDSALAPDIAAREVDGLR